MPKHMASMESVPSGKTFLRAPGVGHDMLGSASNTSYWYGTTPLPLIPQKLRTIFRELRPR